MTVPDGGIVPDWEIVQLAHAHHLVQVSRATVYRWYAEGWLKAREIITPGRGTKLYVYAGDVRDLHFRLRQLRHAERGVAKSP